ncbi:MAG: hypothetical protein IJZ65_01300 [Ruminiclostridium sp.]|nr:hypothetical protein [Ruminiclostridium sp.]
MMEVIKGRVVASVNDTAEKPEKEVELMSAPVSVHRYRLPLGAIVIVKVVLSVIIGGLLAFSDYSGDLNALSDILRKIICG